MKAMIMAAGRGERLKPLTDKTPKPLVKIAEKPLIVYHLEALSQAGIKEIVINVSYLGQKIEKALGNGNTFQLNITYSREDTPLEVGGGICQALPLLGKEPFIVINADVFTDFPFTHLPKTLPTPHLGHLIMVPNPKHHPDGDFGLKNNLLTHDKAPKATYSGISVLHPKLFENTKKDQKPLSLAPLLKTAITQKALTYELYKGLWSDVGTLDRLESLL